jgi:hypothetical protein
MIKATILASAVTALKNDPVSDILEDALENSDPSESTMQPNR